MGLALAVRALGCLTRQAWLVRGAVAKTGKWRRVALCGSGGAAGGRQPLGFLPLAGRTPVPLHSFSPFQQGDGMGWQVGGTQARQHLLELWGRGAVASMAGGWPPSAVAEGGEILGVEVMGDVHFGLGEGCGPGAVG